MFEKAAKEHAEKILKGLHVMNGREWAIHDVTFKDGVEYGIKLANEWHYGTPDTGKDLLCQTAPDEFEVGYYHPEDERFYTMDGRAIDVIAWKKILPPKVKNA